MKKIDIRCPLFPLLWLFVLLWSCGTSEDYEDEVIEEDETISGGSSSCNLTYFRLGPSLNGLDSNLIFSLDKSTNTYSAMLLTWIDKDDPTMLIPSFGTTGAGVYVNGNKIVSGETAISFADDFTLVVRAEDGTEQNYTISLNCPQINTELPVLRLQPDAEVTDKVTYISTTLEMYSPDTDEGWWSPEDGKIEMRGRGNSTWNLPKKPYRLKFPEKVSPIGLNHAKAKSWNILAHDMDKSLLRNHLGFEISRLLFNESENYHDENAIMFTPCSQFVNIYWHDDYLGVYQMTDQMERRDGRIAVEKLTASDGSDADLITGGHILECNIHSSSEPRRFYTSIGAQIDHRYPEDDDYDPAQYSYIEDFITHMEEVLYSDDFTDPDIGWRSVMDEKTLADFIIVKELAGDMDGYTGAYFYKRRGVEKLFFGPVWDMDKGWDNDCRWNYIAGKENNLMIHAGFYMPGASHPDWFERLWQDESLRSTVATRWKSKRSKLLAKIYQELSERPAAMAKAIEANFTVWEFYYQANGEANMPAETYELEIDRIGELTADRAALLDDLFNQ